tara:strand:- start:528 stop:641 length:114 start_codon:yes stop_codon:yes gene_type:complete
MFDIIGKVFFLSVVFLAGDIVGIAGVQQLFVSMFGAG